MWSQTRSQPQLLPAMDLKNIYSRLEVYRWHVLDHITKETTDSQNYFQIHLLGSIILTFPDEKWHDFLCFGCLKKERLHNRIDFRTENWESAPSQLEPRWNPKPASTQSHGISTDYPNLSHFRSFYHARSFDLFASISSALVASFSALRGPCGTASLNTVVRHRPPRSAASTPRGHSTAVARQGINRCSSVLQWRTVRPESPWFFHGLPSKNPMKWCLVTAWLTHTIMGSFMIFDRPVQPSIWNHQQGYFSWLKWIRGKIQKPWYIHRNTEGVTWGYYSFSNQIWEIWGCPTHSELGYHCTRATAPRPIRRSVAERRAGSRRSCALRRMKTSHLRITSCPPKR